MADEPERIEIPIAQVPPFTMPPPPTQQEHLDLVVRDATRLAETLRDASDAGVSHALILPQLVLVFKTAFGEMPAGFTMPGGVSS